MMPIQSNTFHHLFNKAWDLLPDSKTRNGFTAGVAGAMAVYLDQHTMEQCLEIALETSQGIRADIHLVQK